MAAALSECVQRATTGETDGRRIAEKALGTLVDGKVRSWEIDTNGHWVNVPDHLDPDINYQHMTETMPRLEALSPKAAAIDPTKSLRAVLTWVHPNGENH